MGESVAQTAYGYAMQLRGIKASLLLAFVVLAPLPALAGTTTYTYDELGRLITVTTPADAVTNSYDAAGNRTQQVIATPPIANALTIVFVKNSTSNSIPLTITGGTPISVAVSTNPTHGSASASGLAISYSPTSGYTGGDSMSYTATNTHGTSSPALVTISVVTGATWGSFSWSAGNW